MKKTFGSGLAALLCISVLAMVGCSAETEVRQEPVAAPSKVTPKITITTETRSDAVRAAPSQPLATTEQAPPQEGSCTTDDDCIVVPEPIENCIPCLNGGQRPISKQAARQVMSGLKDKCMPIMQKLQQGGQQPQRSQDQSCQFNGAKCVEGQCQLANVAQQQQGGQGQGFQAPQGQGQGDMSGAGGQGGYAGGTAPDSSILPADWGRTSNYPGYGSSRYGSGYDSTNQQMSYPQGYGRNSGYPNTGNFGSNPYGRSPFGNNQADWNNTPGSNPFTSRGSNWGNTPGSNPYANSNWGNNPGNPFSGRGSNWGNTPGSSPYSNSNWGNLSGRNGYPGRGSNWGNGANPYGGQGNWGNPGSGSPFGGQGNWGNPASGNPYGGQGANWGNSAGGNPFGGVGSNWGNPGAGRNPGYPGFGGGSNWGNGIGGNQSYPGLGNYPNTGNYPGISNYPGMSPRR
jgi:hypothetical protein